MAPVRVSVRIASMKALPKRKGNDRALAQSADVMARLNESPSQKEGKYHAAVPPNRETRRPQ